MIKTSGIKYLGSKSKFTESILAETTESPNECIVLDVFMGSARVAQAYRQAGYTVGTSELLAAGEAYSHTYIANPSSDMTNVSQIIDYLNTLPGQVGWLTDNYGEAQPQKDTGTGKLVNAFTRANAMKADAIREAIEIFQPELQHWEYMTLITSLINAMSVVQNSQGHSRAFFRDFMKFCHNPLVLELPPLIGNPDILPSDDFATKYPVGQHFTGDVVSDDYAQFVNQLANGRSIVAYADPPYTTNLQYNQFYHIWDSVMLWDKPSVIGATNQRSDRTAKDLDGNKQTPALVSDWSKRGKAKAAFEGLFDTLSMADTIILSYSDESILTQNEVEDIYENHGFEVITNKRRYQRHAMSKSASASDQTIQDAKQYNNELMFIGRK